ncbi:hypothetical protein [Methylobacterium sp. A54F]
MTRTRWAAALGLLAGAAQAADMPDAAPPAPVAFTPAWVTTVNTEVRSFAFSGTKGQAFGQAANGVRGSGEQLYLPFGLGLSGQPAEDMRFDLTVRGGYADTRQTTVGLSGSERTALDTQLSATATYLGAAGFQPFLSLNVNLPTGDTFLGGNRFRARLDSDLVDVPVFGEGLNFGPTLGVNVPLGETMLLSFGVGYTIRGQYDREGFTDPVTGLTATTRLEPGNSVTGTASLSYQAGPASANIAFVYIAEAATRIDGTRALRSGDRLSLSATAAYAWTPEWATTLSGSFTHTENNFVPGAVPGLLVRENANANSNLYRVGLDTLYTTGPVGLGPTLSFLYRDRNAFDARTLVFVPQRERYGAGGILTYALTETVTLSLRGERIFVREAVSPDKIFDPVGIVPGTGQPRISYHGYSVGGGVTFKF